MSCQEKVNGKTCGGTLEPGEEICSTCNPAHFAKIECKCGVRVREGGTCGNCEQTVCSSVGKAVSVQQVQIKQCAGTKKNGEPCVFLLEPEFQACPICLTEVPWLSPPETEGRLPESGNDATSNQASQSDMAGFSQYAGMSFVDKVINAVKKAEVSNISAEEEKKDSNNKELSKGVNAEEKNTSINLSDSGNRRNSRSAGSGRGQQTSGCSDTASYRNASTATASAELKPLEKATSSDTSQRPVQVQNEQSGDATMENKEQENAKDKQKLAQKNKGRSEQNSRSKNQSLEGARDDGIVVFHVIMSQLFKMDSDTDQVFIRCQPVHLGGFIPEDGDKHRMLLVKKCQVGYVYEGKIAMDKNLRNNGFAYKYVVKKHDKDDVHWEMVQKRDLSSRRSGGQETVNRRFKMPAEERMFCGEWHVYDGISYPRMSFKDAAVDTLKSAFGFKDIVARVRAESHHAGKEFLPSADHIYQTIVQKKHQQTAEDLLRQTKTVMRSLKQQMLDSNLMNVDDDLVQQCFTENLIEPLLKRLSSMLKEGKRTVTLAMLVLLMIVENGIKASTSVNSELCRMFLLIPDNERKHCPDLTDLEKQFPLKMKERV
ncbi:hypothetical protein V1264_015590 [Littorina saxatilis]|uniref:Uncharacterized protein n=2 Tax=Littorina saxatilis TaxID=31220 RepID=A0AAN9GGY7_9CAEN